MKQNNHKNKIIYPGFIIAVLILLINDFVLKTHFHNYLTGKLSDFSGLFALPFFIAVFLPKRKITIYVVTAFLFILWKSPYSETFINIWNNFAPYDISRVIDYSDLIALSILPLSYIYHSKEQPIIINRFKKNAIISISVLSVFSFLATVGVHGNIIEYKIKTSKFETNKKLQAFIENDTSYAIPSQYKKYDWHYGGGPNTKDKQIQRINADSASFNFYFPLDSIIIWTAFLGLENNWYDEECVLTIRGYMKIGENWKFDDNISKQEQLKIQKLYQDNILNNSGVKW